jgi:hypothetical protein
MKVYAPEIHWFSHRYIAHSAMPQANHLTGLFRYFQEAGVQALCLLSVVEA